MGAACGLDAVGSLRLSDPLEDRDASLADASVDPGGPVADGGDGGGGGGSDGAGGCPPAMVGVDAGGLAFCIDGVEVTEAKWGSFLAADAGAGIMPAACAFKTAYAPGTTRGANRPVGSVDWCDAFAFCAWEGKRLCKEDEWVTACTGGTSRVYPYGDTFDGATCNGSQFGAPVDVGTMPDCRGPIPGIWDMSGNIDEWSAACSGDAGATDNCRTHGGDYSGDPPSELTCASIFARPRSAIIAYVGFRCCK
jgi:formylglycine-generating enzyme